MKYFIVIAFILCSFSLSISAQCDEPDSHTIENFISYRKKIEERKKQKPKKPKIEKETAKTLGDFTISGSGGSESDSEGYPTDLMTWGIGFSESLAKIVENEKSGFINHNGQIVIKPKYTMASCFSEGLAAVEIKEKWGFINQAGKLVIPAKFEAVGNFSEGLALFKVGKLWGYINQTGNIVIQPKYENAESFSEGFAVIQFYDKDYVWTTHKRQNGKWVGNFIDKEGKTKFSQNFDGIYEKFNGGMALVGRNIGYNGNVISESYFINAEGQELWKLESWYMTWFSNDLIVVAVSRDEVTKRDKYSFLDRNGKRVTDKTYDGLSAFSEGLAVASINGKDGFINKLGEFVIEPRFFSADSFSDGLAAVWENNESGFIDAQGNYRFKLKFDWTDGFEDEGAAVAIGDKVGYINQNGEYIWKPTK